MTEALEGLQQFTKSLLVSGAGAEEDQTAADSEQWHPAKVLQSEHELVLTRIHQACSIVSGLIRRLLGISGDHLDAMTIDGVPNSELQNVLYEQSALESVLLPIIKSADTESASSQVGVSSWFQQQFNKSRGLSKRTASQGNLFGQAGRKPPSKLVKLCYRLLMHMCRNHKQTELTAAKHIELFLSHVGKRLR